MGPKRFQMGPKWTPENGPHMLMIFPQTQFHFFRGPISSFGHPPYFLDAKFGLIRPRQYGGLNFQPGWQELLPVGDPQGSQTYVFGPLPPGVGGPLYFYISKNDTWARDRPNLDQGQGSAWTRPGAQPGPGTGLSLGLRGPLSGPRTQAEPRGPVPPYCDLTCTGFFHTTLSWWVSFSPSP